MQISYIQLVVAAAAVAIAFLALLWGIITWVSGRLHDSVEHTVKNSSDLILAKLETLDIKLVNLKANGSDYAHNVNDKVEIIQKTLYTDFYRRDEAESDLEDIKQKLDRVEHKFDALTYKFDASSSN